MIGLKSEKLFPSALLGVPDPDARKPLYLPFLSLFLEAAVDLGRKKLHISVINEGK